MLLIILLFGKTTILPSPKSMLGFIMSGLIDFLVFIFKLNATKHFLKFKIRLVNNYLIE